MKKYDIIIGIDPDVDKSGVAELRTIGAAIPLIGKTISLESLSFVDLMKKFELMRVLKDEGEKYLYGERNIVVVIEAGYLNKGNWHLKNGDTNAVLSAKGNSSGRNHEVARKIVEMARDYFGFEVVEQKPLAKCWKGKDRKITHEELAYFAGIEGRTNQETRDAALLCWNYAGFPIKVKPINKETK